MVSLCDIVLDLPENGKIITGRTLRGVVKYELEKEVAYKTISVSLIGKASCAWYYRHKVHNQPKQEVVHRAGHENHPVGKIYIVQKEKSEKAPISVGTYEHPFEFELSEYIPPSFKDGHSELKYHIIIKFKKFRFFSIAKEFKFKIQICPVIPNSIPAEPIVRNLDKTLNKLLTDRRRKITVKITLDKGYLKPTKELNIAYLVTNDSDVTPSIMTELVHITTYRDNQNYSKVDEGAIDECTVKTLSVPEDSVANLYSTLITPPDLYTIRNSQIVTREFKLKVTLRLPLPHFNASVDIPIFIGEKEPDINETEHESPPTYLELEMEDDIKSVK